MKPRDQRPSKGGGKASTKTLGMSKETLDSGTDQKEREAEERRVTRSMKKGDEKVIKKGVFEELQQAQTLDQALDTASHNHPGDKRPSLKDLDAPQDSQEFANNESQEVSLERPDEKNKKVIRKSKRGRSKKMKRRVGKASLNKSVESKYFSRAGGSESRPGSDIFSQKELDLDITSVTLINESSVNTPNSSGSSSRMAKITWSRFDSYFRKIPMGTKKDIILKTIPTNPLHRKPIIQELTSLEQVLFMDPPWGKLGKSTPYVSKSRLSLPPIYVKSCSLDSIVDLVSKSILKSRGGSSSKSLMEIQKPYFLLFELPKSLSLVALEPKSYSELGVLDTIPTTENPESIDLSFSFQQKSEYDSIQFDLQTLTQSPDAQFSDTPDPFNIKWDILGTLDLSYYQFRYIERYLHDVFFNYDQSHKKIFFTPARINDNRELFTIDMISRMNENLAEFNSLINLNIPPQNKTAFVETEIVSPDSLGSHESLDLKNLLDEFRETNDLFLETESKPSNEDSSPLSGNPESSTSNASNLQTQTPLFREESWGPYRNYDPIYWWVDFVLPFISEDTNKDCENLVTLDLPIIETSEKVYLHKDGLSYIDPPSCVNIGGLHWLDPYKPIRLVRQAKEKDKFNINAQSKVALNDLTIDSSQEEGVQDQINQDSDILLIHPYMMNDFKETQEFNFVEANLERFLPIYNEIVDSILNIRLKIQSKIIYENENNVRITDIPFIWMNVVRRYQIVNSWNKLRSFLLCGYRNLYPAFIKQVNLSKSCKTSDSGNNPKLDDPPDSKVVHLTNVCSVCFNWETDTLKPFVECVRCGVVSHVSCYGVNIPLNELLDFYGWLCDRCEFEKKFLGTQYLVAFNPGSISCVLCSHSGGAMKKTNKGEWVHIVCAIWHLPLVTCEDWKNLSSWNVDYLKRSWTNKKTSGMNNPTRVVQAGKVLGSNLDSDPSGNTELIQRSVSSTSSYSGSKRRLLTESVSTKSPRFNLEKEKTSGYKNLNENSEFSLLDGEKEDKGDDKKEDALKIQEGYPRCIFCQNDNTFGLVGCEYTKCDKVFHPICAWLAGAEIRVTTEPKYSRGETLVGYIRGWRNVQDEALQLVNFECFCLSHLEKMNPMTQEFKEEVNLRQKRYINRDMFPELFNSKYNQKSTRGSQLGMIQRSRTRSISRSKSWDVGSQIAVKKNSTETYKQNQIYYCNALCPDKYDKEVCCVCLKEDSTDFPFIGNLTEGREDSHKIIMGPEVEGGCGRGDLTRDLGSSSRQGTELESLEERSSLLEGCDSNILIKCKSCGLVVHWSCYGIEGELRELEDFICQVCRKGQRPENTSCVLCPRRGGALIEAQGIPQQAGVVQYKPLFVHIICALYTPGVYLLAGGQAYGAGNYLGMTSLVKLQTDVGVHKGKSTFIRRFGGIEGSVQQFQFRDIRNEEQFILEQFPDQDSLEIPNVYCCICKSSYGVNLACSHPGCMRTAHPLCLKLFGCYMETIAEIVEEDEDVGVKREEKYSSVLYVSPNCPPPRIENGTMKMCPRENFFLQKVFCPEHGREMGRLNPGGRVLHTTLTSLRIVGKILDELGDAERLKRQLFSTQLEILAKENPIFSPSMLGNLNALNIYWGYHLSGILQDSVRVKNGTIYKFRDSSKNGVLKSITGTLEGGRGTGNSKSPRRSPGAASKLSNGTGTTAKSASLKRTRSSGEATEVPSLEDAIKEARKQREIYKRELVASGVLVRKRPPPNRSPSIPFSRLSEAELKESAINCLKTVGNSSKLAISLMNSEFPPKQNSLSDLQLQPKDSTTGDPVPFGSSGIKPFCIKQHRHDCFRRRLAEFILYPPPVMDHRRKTIRSLTRQLKQYGVTAEELMASDIPLPLTKSKPVLLGFSGTGDSNLSLTDSNLGSEDQGQFNSLGNPVVGCNLEGSVQTDRQPE
ncbi:PHD-finger domain-containing protein [Cryptosporidium felis]|nr:PHD-finger domain-containing protein [Cryptosporidium felis]